MTVTWRDINGPSTTQTRECGAAIDTVPLHQLNLLDDLVSRALGRVHNADGYALIRERVQEIYEVLAEAVVDAKAAVITDVLCEFEGGVEVVWGTHSDSWFCPRCGAEHVEDAP